MCVCVCVLKLTLVGEKNQLITLYSVSSTLSKDSGVMDNPKLHARGSMDIRKESAVNSQLCQHTNQ